MLLFSTTGRASEISRADDAAIYARFRAASRAALETFCASFAPVAPAAMATCVAAFEHMYEAPPSPLQIVLERCWDLDLFRCMPEEEMAARVGRIATDLGGDANAAQCAETCRAMAVAAIRATGDRVVAAHVDYHREQFPACSRDARTCVGAVLAAWRSPPRYDGRHDDRCRRCGESDGEGRDLLWCGTCRAAWHLPCVTPALAAVPAGDWSCEDCRRLHGFFRPSA